MASEEDSILLQLLQQSGFDEENLPTPTSTQQVNAENKVFGAYKQYENMLLEQGFPILKRQLTTEYLLKILRGSHVHESQECNRVWHIYWIVHSLSLLKKELEESTKSNVVDFLNLCQNKTGGYGGGPGNISHLGATYAAVNALVIIGTVEAYKSINRVTLVQFLNSLRIGDGSFCMYIGGEIDMRAVYCAISIAKLINRFNEDLFRGSSTWIISCQSYEGGFAGTPGMEAHGGFTFCAVAALYLLGNTKKLNDKALLRWIINKQMSYEGGFQGRTNKLVDICYSFWLSAAVAIININLMATESVRKYLAADRWIFECNLLQEYVLICCQHKDGGFMDVPEKKRSPYHTCYALGGLSMAQNQLYGEKYSIGTASNNLEHIHPAYNITYEKLIDVKDYFVFNLYMYNHP